MSGAMQVVAPTTIAETLAHLAGDDGARCIAGGGTLVAMMNASLADDIATLVSLKGVAELRGIRRLADGTLRIGAMSRHAETARSTLPQGGQRVIAEAASVTANRVVRNMGTIGGSVAFADPAADYLPALLVADAQVEIASQDGTRLVPIGAYCLDWYTTVLEPHELITAILVPPAPAGTVGHYLKFTRTGGDYAIVGIAIILALRDGHVSEIRCAVGACGPAPIRVAEAEALLLGSTLEPEEIAAAGALLARACDPVDDVRGSAEYRRLLVPRLLASALAEARRRCEDRS
jgi:carbon-monoxide dehydrogenase medium subunit